MRISVANLEIAKHLIVGAVLFDDEHDMFHAGAYLRHSRVRGGAFRGTGQTDIGGDLHRCFCERMPVGQREFE